MEQTKETFDLKGIKFIVGIMCHGMMPPLTALSFIDSFLMLTKSGVDINYTAQLDCSIVDYGRNEIVESFLNKTDGHKLVFIDCDMRWTPQDLVTLMCWSTRYPLVAAMYPTKIDGDSKYIAFYDKNKGLVCENEDGLVPIDAAGIGFSIIDRSVFNTMKPTTAVYKTKGGGIRHRYFKTTLINGNYTGEDVYFLDRWAKEFGGQVWVDPNVNPGHIGSKVYQGNLRQAMISYNNIIAAKSSTSTQGRETPHVEDDTKEK